MDKQATIDWVYKYLKTQGHTVGKYQDGAKCCAIGCLLNKPLPPYDQGVKVSYLRLGDGLSRLLDAGLREDLMDLYMDIQDINDRILSVRFDELDDQFRILATIHKVKSPC